MKILRNKLKNELNIRTQKNYPIKGVEFIDIMPLIIQKDTLKEIIELFVEEIKNKNIDYIIAPEARGFLLRSCCSREIKYRMYSCKKRREVTTIYSRSKNRISKRIWKRYCRTSKTYKHNI